MEHGSWSAHSSSPSAAAARRIRTRSSGLSSSPDGEIVGEGWHERGAGRTRRSSRSTAAGERARGCDGVRHPRAVRAPRRNAAVRRRAARGRRRAGRRGPARPESEARRRPREASRGGCRDRARGRRSRIPVPPADRGVAHVGDDGSAVRDVQGRDHARRPRPRSGVAVGDGRGVAEARARPAGAVGRGRGRNGHRSLGQPSPRRARRPGCSGSPGGIAFGRGPVPDGSELELRSGPLRDGARSAGRRRRPVAAPRGRADARGGVSRGGAGGQAPRLRRAEALAATGRACSRDCRARSSSRAWRRGRSARTCSSRRTSTSP